MNIVMIDNHELFLESLAAALRQQEGINTVYTFNQFENKKTKEVLSNNEIDLVIIDINLDGIDGFEVAQQLKEVFPEVKIAFITGHSNQIYFKERAIAFNADGFLTKNVKPNDFLNQVKEAVEGEKPGLDLSGKKTPILSDRELELIRLLCKGYTNKELASKFHVTIRQIERHKKNLFDKFQVKSEKEAIRKAIDLGYEIIE